VRIEHWLYTLPLRLRSILRRSRVETELDEELRDHLERKAQALIASGLSPRAAHLAARREFGGVEQAKENCRDQRRVAFLDTLRQDVRYGVRTLRKTPGLTAVAALTLALGIGANTAIFSLVDGILFRALPFPVPDRLVASAMGSYPKGAFAALREQASTMDVAAYAEGDAYNLTGLGEAVRLTGTQVSAELFSVLGARPALGRTFRRGEDIAGQDRLVILSHRLWQQRFGANPAIVGRSVQLDGVSRLVVGVMPAEFRFPSPDTLLWVPLRHDPRDTVAYWAGDFMPVVGRLRPNATIDQADAEIRLFQSRVGTLFPWKMPALWNKDICVIPLQEGLVSGVRTRLLILLGSVALVLLIACANVANLSLSRAAAREREIGVRAALGAGRARIARQLLVESVLLAALGGGLGLLLATQAVPLLKLVLPADTPRLADVHLNWRVLAFTSALAILTGCVFGLAPVLHAWRANLTKSLDSGGRGGSRTISERLRTALAIAQVALSVWLVIAAGLLIRSLWSLSHIDPGFRSDQVVTARLSPNESVCRDPARCLTFYRALLDRVQAEPGVTGAALVNTLPLGGSVSKRSLDLEGYVVPASEAEPLFWLNVVTPDYFRVMGIALESGRAFTSADVSGGPRVAIVTASTARRFWPGQGAVGKHVRFVGEKEWHTVVGVAADVRAYDLKQDVPGWIKGTAYVPFGPHATLEDGRIPVEMTLTIRSASDESQVGGTVRRSVSTVSREVAVSDVRGLRAVLSEAVSTPASTTALFASFAALALVLGSIGVYGVLSFLVSRRTRDIGIRLALGAQCRDVWWLVMREGAMFCLSGIILGVAGALVMTRWLSSELHGVSPFDPLTFVGVTLLVSAVTLLACYVPTRRAVRVDPLIALRSQ
jgi:predicted permease